MIRIIIEIDNNALNEKRFKIWTQGGQENNSDREFAKFCCADRKKALKMVERFLWEIPIAHHPVGKI